MSLSSTLTEAINDYIEKFILNISNKYNLDENEIKSLWGESNNVSSINKKVVEKKVVEKKVVEKKAPSSSNDKKDVDISELAKCNKAELIVMCKTYGHKCSGTKDVLINRLLGKDESTPIKKQETSKTKVASSTVEDKPVVKL